MSSPVGAEERSYLQRSLEDLERERTAGDMSEVDYRRLRARYETRLRALGEGGVGEESTPSPPPPRRRRRRALSGRRSRLITGWTALVCFAAAATLLALDAAGAGPFEPPAQLSVSARVQIMLAEASVLGSKGDITQALATYDRVLALRPTQPEALADGGWLARLAGLARHEQQLVRNGDAEIEAAVASDPHFALARAYDGVLLLKDRNEPRAAAAQFDALAADRPSPTLVRSVRRDALAAYTRAGLPAPALFAGARSHRTVR